MTKLISICLATTAIMGAFTSSASAQFWIEPFNFPIPNPVTPSIPNPVPVPVPSVTPSTADSGETTLRFGIPNKDPNQRLDGFDYSTAEIDAWLRRQNPVSLGLVDIAPDFGGHYTRDLLNAGFEQVRQEERKLEDGLADDLVCKVDEV